jgi:hypothetical protein
MIRLVLMIVVVLWISWTIYATVDRFRLKRRIAGLHEPELWLSRSERRAHARKLLRREDDEYTEKLIERTTQSILNPGTITPQSKESK